MINLRLLQLGDSALPIGGYSQSWGLEAAIDAGLVRDAFTLETWLRSWLRYAVGPGEGVVVAAVHRAAAVGDWSTAAEASELLRVSLTPPSLRAASRDLGGQLLLLAEPWMWAKATTAALRQRPLAEWHHAAVFGALTAAAGAAPVEALRVYFHQAALGVLGAGVRTVPVGHTHGQQVLTRLHDDVAALADELADRPLHTAGSFCPAYEVFCHAQTGLYTRLFRS